MPDSADEILAAARNGEVSAVRRLLQGDPSLVNAKKDYDKTPLHWAAEKNYRELAELLLEYGAELEAEVTWGMTPLQWAANMGSREVADLLLAKGSPLNLWCAAGLGMFDEVRSWWVSPGTLRANAGQPRSRQEADGRWIKIPPPDTYSELVSSAFHIAGRNGHVDVARFLLEQGADINTRGFFGGAALHWAALHGYRDMVEFLIANLADLQMRDLNFGSTAVGWAQQGQHEDIVRLLNQHGVGE